MRFAFLARSVLFAIVMLVVSAAAHAQVRVAVAIAPPILPVYDQPICPGDGYIWTPGYWDYDYDASDYFWVPGTWIVAPEVGFLWTPPWWGWNGTGFAFTAGFWGPTVGFYGGINYGFGYFGHGYEGGRWDGGHFFYNTTINHIDVNVIHNVYNTRINVRNDTHVSYNGHGGIDARASREEEAAARDRHVGPVAAQTAHIEAARSDPQQRFAANHGRPGVVATARPGEFKGGGEARPGEAGARSEGGNARPVVHPKDIPRGERPPAPNTGNANLDKKYQQQQDKLQANQDKERQKLQAQQDKEHQQATRQKADDARNQQMEQRHQQQTQQLQQRHTEQTQHLQQRQSAPRGGGTRR
jgi:hypothetical protein